MSVVPLQSSKEPLFRELRALRTLEGRARARRFLIEEVDALRVALESGARVSRVVVRDAWLAEAPAWLRESGVPLHAASAGLLHKLFPTGKTPDVVADCAQVARPLEALESARRVLLLEDIQDAGNLGSMLRTAAGLGARDVVLVDGLSDLYNRVAVRASMGALFRLRIHVGPLDAVLERLRALGSTLVVTTPHAEWELARVDCTGPLAVALGNETRGASQALLDAADVRVRIPMSAAVESLNVGAACAIALYAVGV